ncbi:MAG: ribosomal large subunit pseudouridine synthase, partial [Methylobacterium brachiatum]|nr:ribosomal large subunit pseudouridine synthase [Methylobacterium brachiatum]
DSIYGTAPRGGSLHLHARTLTIPLYPKREAITVTAPPPPHIADAAAGMGG